MIYIKIYSDLKMMMITMRRRMHEHDHRGGGLKRGGKAYSYPRFPPSPLFLRKACGPPQG